MTGAAGVFGRHIAGRLHRQGATVVGYARHRPTGLPDVEYVEGDIRDRTSLTAAMEGCDAVAHVAWAVTPLRSRTETRDVNVGGTANVLEAMDRTGCPRLVFSSSVLAYGPRPDHPAALKETDERRPLTHELYAAHKAEAEDLIENSGVDAVVTRTAPVVGRSVDNYGAEIFGSPVLVAVTGDTTRFQFIHEEDATRFHAEACLGERTGIVNLGTDNVLGIDDVGRILGRRVLRVSEGFLRRLVSSGWERGLLPVDPDSLDGLRWMPVVDTTRLRDEWGFRCAWTGTEALEDLARVSTRFWFLGNRKVDVPWRLRWAPVDVVPDMAPADGGPLEPAGADSDVGSLDTLVDPRFPIYTAANLGEAFPGPMTPLSLDLNMTTMRGCADHTARMLGLVDPAATELRARPVGSFAHRMYGNVSVLREMAKSLPGSSPEEFDRQYLGIDRPSPPKTSPTAAELLHAARLMARVLPVQWGFEREVSRLVAQAHNQQTTDHEVASLADERLVARIGLLHDLVVQAWNTATTGNLLASGFLAVLERVGGEHAVSGLRGDASELESAEAVRGVRRLADELLADTSLHAELKGKEPDEALRVLHTSGGGLAARFDALVDQVGHRGPGETELANSVFADRPEILLDSVLKAADAPQRFDASPVEVSLPLRAITQGALGAVRRRERARDAAMRFQHSLRTAVREHGRRLASAGEIDDPDGVFYLLFNELEHPPKDAAHLVAERRSEQDRLAALALPAQFEGSWVSEGTASDELDVGSALTGIAAAPGSARGRVRVVDDATSFDLEPGEVLVARVTDTGWTPLFAFAAAVVTDIGGLASHPAIVAREYGIPAVVNTGTASTQLRDGQQVEVDGTAGTVTVVTLDEE